MMFDSLKTSHLRHIADATGLRRVISNVALYVPNAFHSRGTPLAEDLWKFQCVFLSSDSLLVLILRVS